jgi:DNA-damage-inducible protein D
MPNDSQQSLPRISPFDRIKHTTDDRTDYWSARELMPILGYSGWQRFSAVIAKAKMACENSGYAVSDHFNATVKMIELGKGARREVEDVLLSRYACYLVVQNGDPNKPIIALGQTYFAERTYHDEQMQDALAGLTEAQRRLFLRGEVADANVQLAATAYDAGVLTSRDFAVFQDHGYMGLYGGEHSRDIHARKGVTRLSFYSISSCFVVFAEHEAKRVR